MAKVKNPGDIVSMIPYVVGFIPTQSLVLISLTGPRRRFGPCLRMDLAGDAADVGDQVMFLLEVIERHQFGPVILVAYATAPEPADTLMQSLLDRLQIRGVGVQEALRADGRRWWSYTCADPDCCPPSGTEYDIDSSRMAAEAVLHGMTKADSRDALRAELEPASPEVRQQVADLCRVAAAVRPLNTPVGTAPGDPSDLSLRQAAALVQEVQDLKRRDAVWATMTRADAERHYELWKRVTQLAPDPLLPPVGALAAFAAWLSGHGVLASHALDRVAGVDPTYSMMLLIRSLLDLSINPDVWDQMQSTPAWAQSVAAVSGGG